MTQGISGGPSNRVPGGSQPAASWNSQSERTAKDPSDIGWTPSTFNVKNITTDPGWNATMRYNHERGEVTYSFPNSTSDQPLPEIVNREAAFQRRNPEVPKQLQSAPASLGARADAAIYDQGGRLTVF